MNVITFKFGKRKGNKTQTLWVKVRVRYGFMKDYRVDLQKQQ